MGKASRTVTICNMRGLHARAAAKFVKLAGQFESEVRVTKGDSSVGGCSIMGLMLLAAGKGSQIHLAADGADADAAIKALAALVEARFEESE